jgi:hypothetical protein
MKIYFHTPSFSFSFHAHREGRRAGIDSAACFSDGGKNGKDPILTRRFFA